MCLVLTKNTVGLSRAMFDILMYIRFFQNSDGWVMNSAMKEYMNYEIWKKNKNRWMWTIHTLEDKGLIQIRTRQSLGRKMRKGLSETGKSGEVIEYKLTAKGTLLVLDFDRISDEYLTKHVYNKKAISIGQNIDIFNITNG